MAVLPKGFKVSVNNTPQAQADSYTFSEDSGTVQVLDVLGNDRGGSSITLYSLDQTDPLLATSIGAWITLASNAKVCINADGTLTYDFTDINESTIQALAANEEFNDVFTYAIRMGDGTISTTTVTLTFVGENDAPEAAADTNGPDSVVEGGVHPGNTPFAGDGSATGNVLANDTDVDHGAVLAVAAVNGDAANVNVVVGGTYGSVLIALDGNWTYALDNADADTHALKQGQIVYDQFQYTASDEHGATSQAALNIAITGTNDAPVSGGAVSLGALTEDDAVYTLSGTNALALLANASDVDHDAVLAIVAQSYGGTFGSLAVQEDGSWIYTLDNTDADTDALQTGDAALESIAVTVTDEFQATVTQIVNVTINGVTDVVARQAPTDISLAVNTLPGATISGILFSGTLSATDPDSGGFIYSLQAGSASLFALSGDQLTSTSALAAGQTYVANVRATQSGDPAGMWRDETFSVITGTDGNNNPLGGSTGDNVLYGGSGNDFIFALGGDDTVFAQAGNDNIVGGGGADRLYGGAGNDAFMYTAWTDSGTGAGNRDVIMDYTHSGPGSNDVINLSGLSGVVTATFTSNGSDGLLTVANGTDTLEIELAGVTSMQAGWITGADSIFGL